MSGSCPPPCSAFSFTAVDSKRVVMYGGTTRSCCEANSDVYIATLTKTSVVITNVLITAWNRL